MARTKNNLLKSRAFWGAAATVMLVGGISIGAVAGYRTLSSAAGAHRGGQGPVSVRFNWPVHPSTPANPDGSRRSWLPLKVQQELTEVALSRLSDSVTDAGALGAAGSALEATGWFESVQSVRRADGNTVEVIGRWRTPVAVVRTGGPVAQVDRLISAKAELLPIDYPAGTTSMRYITGVTRPAPAAFGAEWEGTEVQGALKLLAYIYPTAAFSQVSGVDVSQYASSRRLVLLTDTGARIVWGAAPGEWSPSEPSADQKIAWLLALKGKSEFGKRIDAGRPMLDITSPRGIMTDQPVEAAASLDGASAGDEAPPPPPGKSRTAPADRRRAERR